MKIARPLGIRASNRTTPKRPHPRLTVESLECRTLPSTGQWTAVFGGISPGATIAEQTGYGQNLLHSSGIADADAQVLTALDLTGTFLVQTPTSVEEDTLTSELQSVPGFVTVFEFEDGKDDAGAEGGDEDGGDLINQDYYENTYGPFDYGNYLKQYGNGDFPPQGGPVTPPPGSNDVLTNNNTGASGTGNFTQSETSVVAFGSTVLIAYNDSGSNAGGSNKFSGFSRSTDGGLTFTDGGTLPNNPNGDAGDPVLARDNTTGRIYYATLQFSNGGMDVFHSDDGGATWSLPAQGAPGKTAGGSFSQDKEWIAVDNFAGGGNGNVYLIERDFGPGNGIFFFRSTDQGNTFGPSGGTSIALAGATQGAFVTVTPDHAVEVFWFNGTVIQMRKSTDQGLTFGPTITVASGLVGGTNGDLGLTGIRQGTSTASGFRSSEFPHAAVNPISGNIYVTYANKGAGTDKADVFLVQSTDGGLTWSAPLKVNDDATTTDQWMPTLAVTPDGSKLGIFYYSRQEDAAGNNLFKYYGRIAAISGSTLSFAPSFAVSSVASLPEFGRDTVVNSVYMGDYNTAYATAGAFHVTWSDNRDDLPGGAGRKDPNVYYQQIVLGLAVTTTIPAVGSVVSTPPTTFTVNVTDPLNPATVQSSDLTVNGIPATSVSYVPGSTTLVFTYASSPVTAQGLQTMAIAAGAFVSTGGSPVAPFTGTFRYDAVLLQVVSTNPPVGGVFTLPGPFTYDVNFNEPLDPASVQTGDLVLGGIGGAFVSGVTVLPGNTTARFTISGVTSEGALTATINAGAVADQFGNPGAAFSGTYQVDIGTVPYPTPLSSKNPVGSRAYDPSTSGIINFAGDTDSFTINLDPNQKISVIVTPTSPGLQPRVELFDPTNTSIGVGSAPAAGQVASLQTISVTAGGVYKITVSGLGGTTGGYTVQVILNAAFETEGVIPGSTNNTLATAQDISGAFRTEQTSIATGQIGAVLGTTDNAGYSASAVAFTFEDISGTGTVIGGLTNQDDASASIPVGFSFPFYGTNYTSLFVSSNGLITFGSGDSTFTNGDLTTSSAFAAIAAYWDDQYVHSPPGNVFFQMVGSGSNQHLDIQWNNVQYYFSSGPITYEAQLYADGRIQFNYQNLVGGVSNDNGASATVGIKAAGTQGPNRLLLAFNNGPNAFVGTGQSTLITPPNPTPDLYRFTLTAGQAATLGVAPTGAVGTLNVSLLDSGGAVVATGVAGSTNLSSVINNFVSATGGTYYASVTGATTVAYDLVVTKSAAFDTEGNDTAAAAQSVTGTAGAFGAITGGSIYQATAQTFTFEDISATGTATLQGTDDSTNTISIPFSFPFYGTNYTTLSYSTNGLITFGGADGTFTNADLTTSPSLAAIAAFWDDLENFSSGNGAVYYQVLGSGSNQHLDIEWFNMHYYFGSPSLITFEAQLYADGRIQFNYQNLVGGVSNDNGASATVGIKAAGTQGPNRLLLAFNNGPNAFVGTGKSTLISLPSSDDWYSVTMGPGQTALQVETSTPGDGAGEFVNTLNPKVDVYDSTGTTLLASGVALGDGRNERALLTGLTAGATYKVKISGEAATKGEYFASVTALRTPTVTTQVDDALPIASGPDGSFAVPNPTGNGWVNLTGAGYLNDRTVWTGANPGPGNFANWTIRVTPGAGGLFELFTTWVPNPANATNATYQIYEGTTLRGTVVANQQLTPSDGLLFGTTFVKSLGTYTKLNPATTFFSVRLLTAGANGRVVADAVFDPPAGGVTPVGTAPAALPSGTAPAAPVVPAVTPAAPGYLPVTDIRVGATATRNAADSPTVPAGPPATSTVAGADVARPGLLPPNRAGAGTEQQALVAALYQPLTLDELLGMMPD
jgi:hypothetical protein